MYIPTNMKNAEHVKYLLSNEQDIDWGVVINTVGYQRIGMNTPYPSKKHPTRYIFSTEKGRILNEYQLIYIADGKGEFVSSSKKKVSIEAGSFILLFPGEWHNYKPSKATGWYEFWIGFEGSDITNKVKSGFFKKSNPVLNVGINDDIIHLYQLAVKVAKYQGAGFQQMLSGIVNLLLGYVYAENKQLIFKDLKVLNQINKAKILMGEQYNEKINIEDIAINVGLSYSWFRKLFKQYTGFSPANYIQEIRIQKSKELLTNSSMTSQEIAFEVGFETPYYFCITFKKKTGVSPIKYREVTQGRFLQTEGSVS